MREARYSLIKVSELHKEGVRTQIDCLNTKPFKTDACHCIELR